MKGKPMQILVLCTGNSARSILGEALFNHLGRGRIVARSAGSRPKGQIHPLALEVLAEHGLPVAELRSKSWDEFAMPGAAELDVVVTVCDNAAAESCPHWPGTPRRLHWSLPDPAAVGGTPEAQRRAFHETFLELGRRISAFFDAHE